MSGFFGPIMSLMFALSNTYPDMWKYVPIKKKAVLTKAGSKTRIFLADKSRWTKFWLAR